MKRRLLISCVAPLWAMCATAEPPNQVTVLAPIVVEASCLDEAVEMLPGSVQVFDAATIARAGVRDLPELLAKKANLHIRTLNANPLQAQISLRGFGENSFARVKVIVDGEELNGVDLDAPNLSRIPLDAVSRVEIVRGPSSVLYGDGAVAGVINVRTDDTAPTRWTRLTAKGGSDGTFGANVLTRGWLEEEGIRYSAAYDYIHSDGARARTGYDLHSVLGGVTKLFANGSHLGVRANYSNALYEMPGALDWTAWKADPSQAAAPNDSCRLWNDDASFDTKVVLDDDQYLTLDGAFAFRHRESRWGLWGTSTEYDCYSAHFSPRYVNEADLGDYANTLTVGLDAQFDRQVSVFDRLRGAVLARDEFFLTDDLSFCAGGRGEMIANRPADVDSSDDVMGDFEIGIVYRPVEDLKTFVKGSRFHRSASVDELTYTEDGNPLKPETGSSLDVGADWAFAREWTWSAAGYWMVTEDEIFYNPHAKEYGANLWGGYNCNSPGRTERLGAETSLDWLRDKVAEASVQYALTEAHFKDGPYQGATVPLVPAHRVRAEVGVWLMNDLEVKGGFRFLSSYFLASDFANEQRTMACCPLFDIGAIYEPFWAGGWKATLIVDNLFDRAYCDFAGWSDYSGAYFYPARGRNFLITVSYTF